MPFIVVAALPIMALSALKFGEVRPLLFLPFLAALG